MNLVKICADKQYRTRFLLFLGILGFFVYPIIHAQFYYIDDHGRALLGYAEMMSNGRYFSHILFFIINFSEKISDIAPLTQIISVIVLASMLGWLSVVWKYNLLSGIISLSFIVCSPFFLQNLSFRFDSLYMACAVSCAIMPFCFESIAQKWKLWLAITVTLIASLNFYQAAINTFLVLLCLGSLFILLDNGVGQSLRYFFKRIACLVCAILLYKSEILVLGIGKDAHALPYAARHSILTYSPSIMMGNLWHFLRAGFREFGKGAMEHVLGFGALCGIVMMFFHVMSHARQRGETGGLALFLAAAFLAIALLAQGGLLVLLKDPVFVPRVMMGAGAFLALSVSFLTGRHAVFENWRRFLILLGSWMLFLQIVLAFEWGNAAHAEALLQNSIADRLVEDIYAMSGGEPVTLRVLAEEENVPVAPDAAEVFRKHRILEKEAESLFKGWLWSGILLRERGLQANAVILTNEFPDGAFPENEARIMASSCTYDHMIARRFYTLYQVGDRIIIDINRSCQQMKKS